MARTHGAMEDHAHGTRTATPGFDHEHATSPGTRHDGHGGHVAPFWRHFLEMLAVMVTGMVASGFILLRVVGLTSWDRATILYPNQCLLVMAVGMSVPMVAWMRYRGMGARSSYEMAAAMVLPVIPFLCLVWFGVTESAQCGAYCATTVVAMFVLMRYSRSEYAHQ